MPVSYVPIGVSSSVALSLVSVTGGSITAAPAAVIGTKASAQVAAAVVATATARLNVAEGMTVLTGVGCAGIPVRSIGLR